MFASHSLLDKVSTIEDLQVLARKRVPKMFYEYVDSGSWTEGTYQQNEQDFKKIFFRQRVGIDVSQRNTSSFMAQTKVTMAVALAPVGLTGMQYGDGDILAAQAAEAFGGPFTLSSLSICSLEDKDVKKQLSAPPKVSISSLIQFLNRPRWCFNMMCSSHRTFGNIVGHARGVNSLSSLAKWTSEHGHFYTIHVKNSRHCCC